MIIKSIGKSKGIYQYYFSDPLSKLPIRDVNNRCKQGIKTEPHLEIGAENYIKKCTQGKISNAVKTGVEYLFLVTKCRNKQLKDFYDKQFIVGYIKIQKIIDRVSKDGEKFIAISGESKIVDYKDAISIPEIIHRNMNRGDLSKKIEKEQVDTFLSQLKNKNDITQSWVDEVDKIDENKKTCLGVLNCQFSSFCLRNKNKHT